ncbi:hypothetical protein KKJ06_19790 [Xenorhabdus bovienii]|uniref:hypothetical protein n=1 Tax=Xenorhabdus bovienii TaxID=40576 RepID=UPI0023B23399|nr:hypothetical protein [Xenorhabdus bovienii]MDE9557600.1 hypothetical protein [Xenorhabdus bovienii]
MGNNKRSFRKTTFILVIDNSSSHSFYFFEIFLLQEHNIEYNSSGFVSLLSESKFPISLLGLSPVLLLIVFNIHKATQTEVQINMTSEKNKTDSYYSHLKFITDELNKVNIEIKMENVEFINTLFNYREKKLATCNLIVSNPISLYKKIFNESSPSKGAIAIPNKDIENELLSLLTTLLHRVQAINIQMKKCLVYARKKANGTDVSPQEKLIANRSP